VPITLNSVSPCENIRLIYRTIQPSLSFLGYKSLIIRITPRLGIIFVFFSVTRASLYISLRGLALFLSFFRLQEPHYTYHSEAWHYLCLFSVTRASLYISLRGLALSLSFFRLQEPHYTYHSEAWHYFCLLFGYKSLIIHITPRLGIIFVFFSVT
jgi:hypothetical protein